MYLCNEYGNLSDIVEVPQESLWLADKAMWQLWEHLDDKTAKQQLLHVIGKDRSALSMDDVDDIIRRMNERLIAEGKDLVDKYVRNFRTFGKLLCDLVIIRHNLYAMSGAFMPHQLYLTPQCGELAHHQVLLDEFANINRSYLKEYDEE